MINLYESIADLERENASALRGLEIRSRSFDRRIIAAVRDNLNTIAILRARADRLRRMDLFVSAIVGFTVCGVFVGLVELLARGIR